MINIEITDIVTLTAFWLIFTRWLVILMQLPIFDNTSVPMPAKVLTALIISYAFFPLLKVEMMKDIAYAGENAFWVLTLFNTIIGLAIGFMVKAIMNIFVATGAIITQQIGFSALSYFDPGASQQIGPFENLIKWTLVVIVISSGALLPMFKGIFQSFYSIHIYQLGNFSNATLFFIDTFKGIFIAAIMLASPIIFTNMFLMAVLGVIARTVPQMNVLMVSFVVNIGMGLLVFAACSDEFFNVAFKMYTEKLGQWFNFIT